MTQKHKCLLHLNGYVNPCSVEYILQMQDNVSKWYIRDTGLSFQLTGLIALARLKAQFSIIQTNQSILDTNKYLGEANIPARDIFELGTLQYKLRKHIATVDPIDSNVLEKVRACGCKLSNSMIELLCYTDTVLFIGNQPTETTNNMIMALNFINKPFIVKEVYDACSHE